MKQLIYIPLIFLLISCSKHEEPGDVIFSEFERIVSVITKDTWAVDSFLENGTDFTMEFEELVFNFDENGNFSAESGSNTISGNWEYKSLPFEGELFQIDGGVQVPGNKLSQLWEIKSVINKEVVLEFSRNDIHKKVIFKRLQ